MKRIFFYGDSNTFGYQPFEYYGGRYPEEIRWTGRLKAAVSEQWEIYDDGLNGRCIPGPGLERMRLWKALRERMPLDLFAVMLGTNDYLCQYRPDPAAVAGEMADFLRELRGEFPGLPVLVLGPPAMDFSVDPQMARWSTADGRLSAALRDMAESLSGGSLLSESSAPAVNTVPETIGSGHLIRFLDTVPWDLSMAFDRVHLAPEGHRVFAEQMMQYLCSLTS